MIGTTPIATVTDALSAHGSHQHRNKLWNCPVSSHGKGNGDRDPSLSVREKDGKVVLKCFAGCERHDILAAVGLTWKVLYPKRERGEGVGSVPPRRRAIAQSRSPLTVADYAAAKRVPIEDLRRYGLTDVSTYPGGAAVCIPYFDLDGQEVARRFRLRLEKQGGIDDRFRWRSGAKVHLYGLWRLKDAKQTGSAILVEGESDCHVLWHHGIPALGIPGAATWRDDWAEHLKGISTLYAVVEPDKAGESLRDKLGQTRWARSSVRRACVPASSRQIPESRCGSEQSSTRSSAAYPEGSTRAGVASVTPGRRW